jgi:16S rRNA processing protein RimM
MTINDCFKIGYVAKTHGLKGEVTVIFGNDAPDPGTVKTIYVEVNNNLIPYFIESVSDRGDKAFIKFEDVSTPEQAAQLKGHGLYFPKVERARLARGEFYNDEVIGFTVEDEKSGLLGKIREVLEMGPSRLLAIDGASKEILIPVNGPFIQSINKSKKKFTVDLPEGFLDI